MEVAKDRFKRAVESQRVVTPARKTDIERNFALDDGVKLTAYIKSALGVETVQYTFHLHKYNEDSSISVDDVTAIITDVLGEIPQEDKPLFSQIGDGHKYMGNIEVPRERYEDAQMVTVEFPSSGNSRELPVPDWVFDAEDYTVEDYIRAWWTNLDEDSQLTTLYPREGPAFTVKEK